MSATKTLFPWPGGKTRLLPYLLPLVEGIPHTCYVEALAGGAAVLFAREPAKAEEDAGVYVAQSSGFVFQGASTILPSLWNTTFPGRCSIDSRFRYSQRSSEEVM